VTALRFVWESALVQEFLSAFVAEVFRRVCRGQAEHASGCFLSSSHSGPGAPALAGADATQYRTPQVKNATTSDMSWSLTRLVFITVPLPSHVLRDALSEGSRTGSAEVSPNRTGTSWTKTAAHLHNLRSVCVSPGLMLPNSVENRLLKSPGPAGVPVRLPLRKPAT
jgi:hypothetical protein